MKMNKKELLALIKTGEGYTLEFKESVPSDLGKHICAFANASGGKMILGLKDDGSVIGYHLGNVDSSRIQDTARNMDPQFQVSVEKVENLAVVHVPEGENKPYSSAGHFYLRTGPNSQQMTREEIRNFFQHERLVRFDEKPNRDFSFSRDFDKGTFRKYLSKSGITSVHEDRDMLRNLSLLDGDCIKNAGVMFFCREVKRFFISAIVTCVLYQGTDKVNILDKKEFDMDIMANYENAMTYILSKLNTQYIIKRERTKRLELPEEALREALINAMVHRDYFSTGHVQVDIFLDRMEISNPGGLVSGLSRKDLGKRSMPRNPLLMDLFHRIDRVERVGSGIKRIRKAMKEYGLKVAFDASESWFSVVFKRATEKTVEKTVEKILGLMKTSPKITQKELVQKTGLTRRGIEWNISKLKKEGKIKRVGPAKGGHWKVLKQND
ncbi:putative DNA binding domain-containing protein [Candidatus Woesearchaeota archaeon]|nr:putative DNA binding domain-containing protein [Candidatus Woesearchaeota archaeon]